MGDELLTDLPRDLPSSLKRFGTDAKCRAYLVRARWPAGFRCTGCGHDQAWSHRKRLIEECTACGRQHSILAGTIFEQTKTGLAKWFLAIYLVTSSKGGISAMELQRQMGFGSYQTAWSWLHKIRRAMVRPERAPLAERVEADETYVGGPRAGTPGRGAAGKIKVAGAVESGRGQARGRRLGRLRLAVVDNVTAKSLQGFLGQNVARPATVATHGWSGYAGLDAAGYRHEAFNLSATWGDAALRLPASTWCSAWPSAGCSAPTTAPSARSICRPTSTSLSSASTAAPPGAPPTASPASSSKASSPHHDLPRHRRRTGDLRLVES
jgi:transposase-like protein